MTHPKTNFSGPEICALPARDVVAMLKAKQVSPAEVLAASQQRMDQVEPAINAVVTRCDDRARTAANAVLELAPQNQAEPGWLAGLPIGIKDLTMVKGVRTTFGTIGMQDFIATETDPLVERLEQRGGIVVGKTNTPEFGAGGNATNAIFGSTRNPWDTRMNAGGSSGGAAASLAAGEVWLSHGSDLAGSLRTPAAFCGVVGLRPSPGRCGGGPKMTAFSIEGIQGPMARDIGDLALFLDAMAGFDPRQPTSLEAPQTPFQAAISTPGTGYRIAFSEDQGGFAPVEPEMRQMLRGVADLLSDEGFEVTDTCPDLPELHQTYSTLRGVHYGSINAYLPDDIQRHFKPTLKQNTDYGRNLSTQQIYDALRQRTVLYQNMRELLEHHDVFAIPVTGIGPGPVEVEYPPAVDGVVIEDYVDWLRFSFLATTTALPALSIPVGFNAAGLPVGLQLIGSAKGEAKLLKVAAAIERVVGFPTRPIDPITHVS